VTEIIDATSSTRLRTRGGRTVPGNNKQRKAAFTAGPGNMLLEATCFRATCCLLRQHVPRPARCCPDVASFATSNMLATYCLAGQHVACCSCRATCCPGVNAALWRHRDYVNQKLEPETQVLQLLNPKLGFEQNFRV